MTLIVAECASKEEEALAPIMQSNLVNYSIQILKSKYSICRIRLSKWELPIPSLRSSMCWRNLYWQIYTWWISIYMTPMEIGNWNSTQIIYNWLLSPFNQPLSNWLAMIVANMEYWNSLMNSETIIWMQAMSNRLSVICKDKYWSHSKDLPMSS